MNLISKIKKISACSLASVGVLFSTGSVGLNAMFPSFQFSNFNQQAPNLGNFSFQSNTVNYAPRNTFEDSTMDVEEDSSSANFAPMSQQNFTFQQLPAQMPRFDLTINNYILPNESGKNQAPRNSSSVSNPAPQNVNTSNNPSLSFVSLNGRNARTLSDKEKTELARRGFALLSKGESYASAARKLGISDGTLKNWIYEYCDATVKYSKQEKQVHVSRFLYEHSLDKNVNVTDYANRNGLLASTFRNWVRDYQAGRLK